MKKFIKKIEKAVKKVEHKFKNDRKLKDLRRVAKIVLPFASPFISPLDKAITFLNRIPK